MDKHNDNIINENTDENKDAGILKKIISENDAEFAEGSVKAENAEDPGNFGDEDDHSGTESHGSADAYLDISRAEKADMPSENKEDFKEKVQMATDFLKAVINSAVGKVRRSRTGKPKEKKHGRARANTAWGFLIAAAFLGTIIPCSVHWALSQFANLKMDEIVYELTAPLEGTGNGMIGDYIGKCLVPAIIVSGLCVAAGILWKKRKYFTRICLAGIAAGAASVALSINVFGNSTDLWSYIKNSGTSSDFIEKNYVNPADTKVTFPEKKRNLIYIYLESMEISFADQADGGAYDVNYIPELTRLAEENEDFSGNSGKLDGAYSMPGTTWTIGGMFAQSSGLPLKMATDDNSMSNQKSFFPGITVLGDILKENGYTQELMVGSDASFGGRRLFYTEHGSFDIFDLNYAHDTGLLPADYNVFWGFEDSKLFAFAKDELTKLGSGGQPFNFTMLTENSHFPDGYTEPSYEGKYDEPYANALACSSEQVAEFIKWCKTQDWFENTTIILNGDHPTMSTFSDSIPDDYTRKTYTCYINSAGTVADPERTRTYTTFDSFPTTLAALGCAIDGERLGLGTNLFSDTDTYTEIYGYDVVSEELSKQSDFLSKIEKLDNSSEKVVDYYADTVPEINYSTESGHLTFTLRNVKMDGTANQTFFVRIWNNDGGSYMHDTVNFVTNDNKTWQADLETGKNSDDAYRASGKVYYQIMTTTDEVSGINVGPQGELDLTRDYTDYVPALPADSAADSAA